jgi:NAD(P)H-flavin reductase
MKYLARSANNMESLVCNLIENISAREGVFTLEFAWKGPAPKAGQFFMVKPSRCSFFLARPLSVMEWKGAARAVKFLVARRGKGTQELSLMRAGEEALLTGPLGNAWDAFLPPEGKTALVGGGLGLAPLAALAAEKPDYGFHFYAGFKQGFSGKREEAAMLGEAINVEKLVIAAEDGKRAVQGLIVDFVDWDGGYSSLFACGPEPMLKAVKARSAKAGIPCFLSLERRMACGVGACLGCTVHTVNGNRRCCADGPVFAAEELVFDE